MNRFFRRSVLPLLRIAVCAAAATLLTGCPATTGSDQAASTQPEPAFRRGGDIQNPVDTTVGAGHSASNGGLNFGGGMGGTQNVRTH